MTLVRGVFVSIDGQRDDTARTKECVARFDTRLVGLTVRPEATVAAANAFGVLTRRFQGKTALAYTLSHSSLLYPVDPQGRLRYVYSERATPAQIAQDLEGLGITDAPAGLAHHRRESPSTPPRSADSLMAPGAAGCPAWRA